MTAGVGPPAADSSALGELLRAGSALLRAGQSAAAEHLFRSACARWPGSSAAWIALAQTLAARRRLAPALEAAERACAAAPDATEPLCLRASLLEGLARVPEALGMLQQAQDRDPRNPTVLLQRAALMERSADPSAALEALDALLAIVPDHAEARMNRAGLWLDAGDAARALEAFDALAHERPGWATAHRNRARALFELGDDDGALAAVEKALAIEPGHPRALLDRALALSALGRLRSAVSAFETFHRTAGARAQAIAGRNLDLSRLSPRAVWLERALLNQSRCNWGNRARLVRVLRNFERSSAWRDAVGNPGVAFFMLALPLDAVAQNRVAAASAGTARRRAKALALPPMQNAIRPARNRIRVAVLSAEIRTHPGARFLRRLFLEDDRGRFEYFVYALNPDGGDAIRKEIATSVDRFIDVSAWTSREIVERIRADEIDLLIDKGGYFEGSRPEVLAARAAPVQAIYLGYPGTLGGLGIDYRLSDAWTTPPQAQADHAEQLVLLPETCAVYDNSIVPAPPQARGDHDLPGTGFVWCAMHQAFKIEPSVFSIWMRLIGAVPDSVLWLLDPGPVGRANLCRESERRGIDAGRLVFAPRMPFEAHLGRLAHADIFLDTLYCGGHTTALDALWAGVPVLGFSGATYASRLGSAFLRAAGCGDMIASSEKEYESMALAFARDSNVRTEYRARLARQRHTAPAFATIDRVRALERAFIAMVERSRAGLPPALLRID